MLSGHLQWSFGVTLWELLSCAQQPYVDVDPDEMTTILEQGQRLIQPYNCPDDLLAIVFFLLFLKRKQRIMDCRTPMVPYEIPC